MKFGLFVFEQKGKLPLKKLLVQSNTALSFKRILVKTISNYTFSLFLVAKLCYKCVFCVCWLVVCLIMLSVYQGNLIKLEFLFLFAIDCYTKLSHKDLEIFVVWVKILRMLQFWLIPGGKGTFTPFNMKYLCTNFIQQFYSARPGEEWNMTLIFNFDPPSLTHLYNKLPKAKI